MNRALMKNPLALSVGALAALVVMGMSVSVVPETKQAIISTYGQPLRVVNGYKPKQQFGERFTGLAFRIPLVEQIQFIDKRVLSVEMERQEVLSTDQLRLQVDAFARFRVTRPIVMYKTIRTEERLRDQLRTILGSSLRNELGRRSFATMLSPERGEVMENVQRALNREARKYGAEIIDVRIKRVDFVADITDAVYRRMESERKQVANELRSQGSAEGEKIRADADRQREVIIAEAYRDAQKIKGEGDAQAARIYGEAFGRDPQFAQFYRSLEAYKASFAKKSDIMVLDPASSDFFKTMRGAGSSGAPARK